MIEQQQDLIEIIFDVDMTVFMIQHKKTEMNVNHLVQIIILIGMDYVFLNQIVQKEMRIQI
jgi:hypothetical protein